MRFKDKVDVIVGFQERCDDVVVVCRYVEVGPIWEWM